MEKTYRFVGKNDKLLVHVPGDSNLWLGPRGVYYDISQVESLVEIGVLEPIPEPEKDWRDDPKWKGWWKTEYYKKHVTSIDKFGNVTYVHEDGSGRTRNCVGLDVAIWGPGERDFSHDKPEPAGQG